MQKDTTLKKIFVGGLPYHTTDESLKEFFKQYGTIEEAVVITDRQTGKSRGYGFVTMARSEEALMAIRDPNPCIDGRKANVNLAVLGAKPRQLPGASANLFSPIASMPMSANQFYPNPLANQANLLSYNTLGMSGHANSASAAAANLAMKSLLMQNPQQATGRQQQQQPIPSPAPGVQHRQPQDQQLLLNSFQTTPNNSLMDYLNVLLAAQNGPSMGHQDASGFSSLGQQGAPMNPLYMLNQQTSQPSYNMYSQHQNLVMPTSNAGNDGKTGQGLVSGAATASNQSQGNGNGALFENPFAQIVNKGSLYHQLPVQTQEF